MESKDNSAWTADLVYAHLQKIIDLNDKRYAESFMSSEKAVSTAFMASEKAIRDTLAAVEKGTAAAFVAAEKAVALAEANAERWRADASDWRARMTDREKSFSTKAEFNSLKERMDRGEGSGTGKKDLFGWVITGIMTLIAIGSLVIAYLK